VGIIVEWIRKRLGILVYARVVPCFLKGVNLRGSLSSMFTLDLGKLGLDDQL